VGTAAAALVLAAAGIGLAVAALRQPPPSEAPTEPTVGLSWQPMSGPIESPTEAPPSPTPSPSYLALGERWAPPTYQEGDRTVMPVTFPDGTTAELVYPPELGLEDLSVYPYTFAEGGPSECGWSVSATRYDPLVEWVKGDAPLTRYLRQDGTAVALWEGTRDHAPYHFLVYRFGPWSVLVPCGLRLTPRREGLSGSPGRRSRGSPGPSHGVNSSLPARAGTTTLSSPSV